MNESIRETLILCIPLIIVLICIIIYLVFATPEDLKNGQTIICMERYHDYEYCKEIVGESDE